MNGINYYDYVVKVFVKSSWKILTIYHYILNLQVGNTPEIAILSATRAFKIE